MDTTDVSKLLYRIAESFEQKAKAAGSDHYLFFSMEACSVVMRDAARSIDSNDTVCDSAPAPLPTTQNES